MNKRPPLRRSAPIEAENDGVIEGRNAVVEALRAGVTIDKIFIMKGETDSVLGHIASTAREQGIVVVDADRRKLDNMSRTHSHQGVIALAAVRIIAPRLWGSEISSHTTSSGASPRSAAIRRISSTVEYSRTEARAITP